MIIKTPVTLTKSKTQLFKPTAYDIRCYVGEPEHFFCEKAILTPDTIYFVGLLMATTEFVNTNGDKYKLNIGDNVVIGYDNGPTSKQLAKAFAQGLTSQGVNVYDIGLASSGQVYHNATQLKANGYVQITRSHVEVTTNGAKFGIEDQGIHTYLLEQMFNAASKEFIGRNSPEGKVINRAEQGYELYYRKICDRYLPYFFNRDNSKIAVNLFGGTAIKYKPIFTRVLGENAIILGEEVDANSGGLLADPTRKEMLCKVDGINDALDNGYRIHSFDLDADRGSLTEGEGCYIDHTKDGHYLGDNLSYILADYKLTVAVPNLIKFLQSKKIADTEMEKIKKIASTVYTDPRYTSGMANFVLSKGGSVVYHPKGHSLWKETISKNIHTISELAGYTSLSIFAKESKYQDMQIEASLHLFVTDPEDGIPRDDAVENLFVLEMVQDTLGIKALKDYFDKIPKRFATKEIRTNAASNDHKEKITNSIITELKSVFNKGKKYKFIEFDGQLRVEWSTGFIMYGMSNTSPKLTFMVEGATVEERNLALTYILALHNKTKKTFGDATPMDLSENNFFIQDTSYHMSQPDDINELDKRVAKFISSL